MHIKERHRATSPTRHPFKSPRRLDPPRRSPSRIKAPTQQPEPPRPVPPQTLSPDAPRRAEEFSDRPGSWGDGGGDHAGIRSRRPLIRALWAKLPKANGPVGQRGGGMAWHSLASESPSCQSANLPDCQPATWPWAWWHGLALVCLPRPNGTAATGQTASMSAGRLARQMLGLGRLAKERRGASAPSPPFGDGPPHWR
jgi:hypothetical protein